MAKKIAWFVLGAIISIAGIALADSFGTFRPATGILKGDANSPVTVAATASDVNALYNTSDFRAGQNVTSCNLATASSVSCSETNAKPAATFIHSRVGNSAQVVGNFSNFTDSDLQVTLSEVGATNKFARIGPSVNVPLQIMSRGTVQEVLKSASISFSGSNCSSFSSANFTSCSRTGVGLYNLNVSAAAFTTTPVCTCSIGDPTATPVCRTATSGTFLVAVNVLTSPGVFYDASAVQVICVGR